MNIKTFRREWLKNYILPRTNEAKNNTFDFLLHSVDEFYERGLDKRYEEIIQFIYENYAEQEEETIYDMEQNLSLEDFLEFQNELDALDEAFYEEQQEKLRYYSFEED